MPLGKWKTDNVHERRNETTPGEEENEQPWTRPKKDNPLKSRQEKGSQGSVSGGMVLVSVMFS